MLIVFNRKCVFVIIFGNVPASWKRHSNAVFFIFQNNDKDNTKNHPTDRRSYLFKQEKLLNVEMQPKVKLCKRFVLKKYTFSILLEIKILIARSVIFSNFPSQMLYAMNLAQENGK